MVKRVAEIHIEQKVDALVDAVEIDAGNGEIAAAMRADCNQDGIEVAAQIGDGEVAAGRMIEFQRDIAGGENLAHLRFHHVAGQAIFGQAEIEHAARHLRGFKDGDGVAHQGKIVGGRKSHRTGAHDGNAKGKLGLGAAGVYIDGMPRLRAVSFGKKALERADRDRLVDLAAAACGLAGMSADASADAGHGIGFARDAIGLFKLALRNQRNIAARVGVRGASHHAGEVGVQPIPVNLLVDKSLQHAGPFPLQERAAGGRNDSAARGFTC